MHAWVHSYFVCQVRENQVGYWFVDGQSYFSAVYDVIDMAQVYRYGTAALFMCLFSYLHDNFTGGGLHNRLVVVT